MLASLVKPQLRYAWLVLVMTFLTLQQSAWAVELPEMSRAQNEAVRQAWDLQQNKNNDKAIALLQREIEAKDHAALRFYLGNIFYVSGQGEQALEQFNRCLQMLPDYLPACRAIGILHYEKGEYRQALSFLSRSVTHLPPARDDLLILGSCQNQLQYSASAHKTFEWAVSLYPQDLNLRKALADSCMQLGRYTEASEWIRESLEMKPLDAALWRDLAAARLSAGSHEGALDALEASLLLSPDQPAIQEHLADLYFQQSMYKEALPRYQALLPRDKNDSARLIKIARCYLAMQEFDQCLKLLEQEDVDQEETLLLKVEVLQRMGRNKECLEIITKNSSGILAGGRIPWLAGICAYHLERFQEAKNYFSNSRSFIAYRSISIKYLILIASRLDEKDILQELISEGMRIDAKDPWFRKMWTQFKE